MARTVGALNRATKSVRALAQKHGPAAIRQLASLAEKAESEAARVAAIKELLDRGYGKSPQPLDGDGAGGPIKAEVVLRIVDPKR